MIELQNIIETMNNQQRTEMLHDVIQNMVERGSSSEIARFVAQQLDGDAIEVATSYARKAVA